MKKESIELLEKRMVNNPIAKAAKLAAGDYAIQKTNDDYTVLAEVAGSWNPVSEAQINTIPKESRWILLNSVLNHKTGKVVSAAVGLDYKAIALKTNLLMNVNNKGYTSINLTPLTAKELKAFKSEVIEEPATV